MLESLPKSIRDELHASRTRGDTANARLRIEANGVSYKILRMTPKGFALGATDGPNLRGLVDLFDGSRHISQCLIVAATKDGDNMIYEIKRNATANDGAPLDFERPQDGTGNTLL